MAKNVCEGCKGMMAVVLIVGIIMLLKDYGVSGFDWYRIGPWTAVFVIIGAHALCCKCRKK